MNLQFRLRTLMIVVTLLAVPLGYVGWQAKIVRARRDVLQGPSTYLMGYNTGHPAVNRVAERPSLIRRWLGDEAITEMYFTRAAKILWLPRKGQSDGNLY